MGRKVEQTCTFPSVGVFEMLNFSKLKSWCRIFSEEFASSSLHIVIAQPEYKIKFAVFTIIMQLDIIRLIIQTNEENIYIFINLCNPGTCSGYHCEFSPRVQLGVQSSALNWWDVAALCFQDPTPLVAVFFLAWIGPFSRPDKLLLKVGSLSLGAAFQRLGLANTKSACA